MIKKIIYTLAVVLIFVNCDKKKDKNEFVLNLGKPGEISVNADLKTKDNVITLDSAESVDFITDNGEAIIKHDPKKQIHPGDIIVANENERYILKVKEVREVVDRGTHVVVRQANIEDILTEGQSVLKLEATPKYDLPEIEKYIQMASETDTLETIKPTVDQNGKITVRNLELFSIQLNDEGNITKNSSTFFGKKISRRNKPLAFNFTAGGLYQAKINEMIVELIPTVRNEMEWQSGKVKAMDNRFDTLIKYKIDITYKMAGLGKMEAMIDLLPVKKIPLRVPGTPPVWLDIELSLPAGVSMEATAKGETRVVYEAEYGFFARTSYNRTDGIKTAKNQTVKIKDTKIIADSNGVEIRAEVFLKPTVMVRAYRIAGPYAYLQPYVRGELELPRRQQKDDLYVGVKGGVGIEFSEPIFTTAIMSYDSGAIFDFNKSFDLDGFTGAPRQSVGPLEHNDIYVDQIGNEGFVVINAKTVSKDAFARFELLKATGSGILVPAEDFYISGNLHYYPLPHTDKETFTIRITESDGRKFDTPIAIAISDSVKQNVSKERFGVTTNSYRVAIEGSTPFADEVPHYSAGPQIFAVRDYSEREALRRENRMKFQTAFNIPLQSIEEQVFSMVSPATYWKCAGGTDAESPSYEARLNCYKKENTSFNIDNLKAIDTLTTQALIQRPIPIFSGTAIIPIYLLPENSQVEIETSATRAIRFLDMIHQDCFVSTVDASIEDKNKMVLEVSDRNCLVDNFLGTRSKSSSEEFFYRNWSFKPKVTSRSEFGEKFIINNLGSIESGLRIGNVTIEIDRSREKDKDYVYIIKNVFVSPVPVTKEDYVYKTKEVRVSPAPVTKNQKLEI